MKCIVVLALALAVAQASPTTADLARLLKDLPGEDYNRDVYPVGEKPTNVSFGLSLMCMDIDNQGILKGRVWLRVVWNDERLKYNPDDFNGIGVVRLNPSKVWIPDLYLYNRADSWRPMYPDPTTDSHVLIYPNGKVLWVPDRYVEVSCPQEGLALGDVWAEQSCMMKYGSWVFDGNILNPELYNGDGALDVDDWLDSCPMEFVKGVATKQVKYYDCCEEPYPNLQFNFTLRRRFLSTNQGIVLNPKLESNANGHDEI